MSNVVTYVTLRDVRSAETLHDTSGPEPAEGARFAPRCIRVFYEGSIHADVFPFRGPVRPLGRETWPDVFEFDPRVSRDHAELRINRQRQVELVPRPGKRVNHNGEPVDGPVTLADGDVLRLGSTLVVLRTVSSPVDGDAPIAALSGQSVEMAALRWGIDRLRGAEATVLILGESGTGKEVVARAIADDQKLVAINCAAVTESLAESMLFGHKKGAFTGADEDREGFFEAAGDGVVFLDEVGELSPTLQAKLLRVLDRREFQRVGETATRRFAGRILAATNRDLVKEVDAGRFRGDLYARLAEVVVDIPPLQKRREDVLLHAARVLPAGRRLSPDLAEAMLVAPWRFNVREVEKVMAELLVKCGDLEILPKGPVAHRLVREDQKHPAPPAAAPAASGPPSDDDVRRLLQEHQGNVSDVARAMGRSRMQVYRWLKKAGIKAEAYRPTDKEPSP